MTSLSSLVAALCLAALPPAFAADAPAAPAGPAMQACAEDAKTLCPGVEPGGGRIAACFKSNRAKLSEGCKAALKAQRGGARKAPAA